MKGPRLSSRTFLSKVNRLERRVLVWWIRFARAHRDSAKLPFYLFFLFFIDGFVMVVPSTVILIAAVMISPSRWFLFGTIFAMGATLNATMTYFLGLWMGEKFFLDLISRLNLESFWERAHESLKHYGSFATLVGALIGLPVQMITAIIGLSDGRMGREIPLLHSMFIPAILFAFIGHSTKSCIFAMLTRYGWLKLENKFGGQVSSAKSAGANPKNKSLTS